MARSLRIEYEGAFYHITARGNERKAIFFTPADYKKFKQYLKEAKQKYRYIIHSYVLMRNHYHLLMETPEANLGKIMHYINSSYTTYINIKRKRSGHLFQGRYKSIVIDKDNYLLELSRYIHLNPVRAGIVEKPEDYEQSSYRAYITKAEGDISNQELILSMISKDKGEARKEYKAFVDNATGKELKNPLKEAYGGIILGGVQFIKETLKKVERGKLRDEEIANRRKIKAVMMQDILEVAKDYYGISEDMEISKDTGERRKVLIYMIKKHTGATNREIGEYFGGLSYSAVAKINDRFKRRLREDKGLRREVEKIEKSV
jgi:putative transposase